MKYVIVIFAVVTIFFVGCKSSETTTYSLKELKKNQFRGVVQELNSAPRTRTEVVIKDIYFTTNSKNYFIKFSEGYVTKEEAMKHFGKEIIIKGEIKNGQWEDFPPSSFKDQKSLKAPRSGEYIVLEKIYKP